MEKKTIKRGAISCVLAGTLALAGSAAALADDPAGPATPGPAETSEIQEPSDTTELANATEPTGTTEATDATEATDTVDAAGATEAADPAVDAGLEPVANTADLGFTYTFSNGMLAVTAVDGTELVVPAQIDGESVQIVNAADLGLSSIDVSACGSTLIDLTCSGNRLIELDLSACSKLTTLDCSNNQLTSIKGPNYPLYSVNCSNNNLASLDFEVGGDWSYLNCSYNQLTELSVDVTVLHCQYNLLESLAFLGASLNCSNNKLTSLDVTQMAGVDLDCSYNQLTELVLGDGRLETIWCNDNQLTSLVVKDSCRLYCNNNQLTSLSVSLNSSGTFPAVLDCSHNQLTELDLSNCNNMTWLNCSQNLLTELSIDCMVTDLDALDLFFDVDQASIDCSGNYLSDTSAIEEWAALDDRMEALIEPQYRFAEQGFTYQLDKNSDAVFIIGVDSDELVLPAELNGKPLTMVYAFDLGLTSIDISACASTLTTLGCYGNELTELDVSKCEKLDWLYCGRNNLTELDLTGCPASLVDVSNNKLESIILNPEVQDLSLICSDNRLTGEFAFSGNSLYCDNNAITSLTVSLRSDKDLAWLNCSNNQLVSLNIVQSEGIDYIDCSNNLLTNLDLAQASNVETLFCADNRLTELDISGLDKLTSLSCEKNYLRDTTALEEWAAVEGHDGTVNPQRDPSTPESGAAELFDDVDPSAWYVEGGYLDFVVSRGIMTGYTDDSGEPTALFGPEDTLTRAQAATIIYRLATGATASDPYEGSETPFSDVEAGAWYTAAVLWCHANGIVTGYTDASGEPTGVFGTEDLVTREQLATMVWRLACMLGASGTPGSDLSSFPDAGEVSAYALDAMAWCNAEGIITGDLATGTPMLVPGGYATRCQAAKILTETAGAIGL